ncbi:LPXTG cell wall anchor domain-containing protein [Erysipelothrix sp. HDW6C]|uniref:leucine-rich repeat domain-containing protein n=1 Tax=Erysipelothrix sp. HDW6C TaxID=2714930 RepID=UPI001407E821|nr:leucine-rich repeat domain-containing protein [Erysipelothrix sp. HDW6C]QIK69210.1 LPXTG cell wall anchor domain-containing protein [Erysipelothrix sp. HDW6C]
MTNKLKKILNVTIAVMIMMLGAGAIHAAGDETIADIFLDSKLASAVANQLGKAVSDPVEQTELNSIKEILITNEAVADLTGLVRLENLIRLKVTNGSLTDLSELSSMTQLRFLYIGSNDITDLEPIRSLVNLEGLEIYKNAISDITPLSNMPKLTYLHAYGNAITDIAPLAALPRIERLDLGLNPVGDVSPLANAVSLTSLQLNSTDISSIEHLSQLVNLKKLGFFNNKVEDISVLENHPTLKSLDFSKNNVSDISILENIQTLTELRFSENNVQDIEALKNLKQLTILDASINKIQDIQDLQLLTQVDTLLINDNEIHDISFLSEFNSMSKFSAANQKIALDTVDQGVSTEIKISDRNNEVPALNFVTQGLYENGELTWEHAESNQLTWDNGTNFSGSINQDVSEIQLNNYTVTFDMGSADSNQISSQTIVEGDTIVPVEAPQRDGFTFEGWGINTPTGYIKWDFINDKVHNDITLVAQWAAIAKPNLPHDDTQIPLNPNNSDELPQSDATQPTQIMLGNSKLPQTGISNHSLLIGAILMITGCAAIAIRKGKAS